MINKNMLEKNVHRFILSSVPSSFIVVFKSTRSNYNQWWISSVIFGGAPMI